MTERVAFVTGASRGLGRAIAARLGETHHVACGYRRERDAVEGLAAELPSGEAVAIDVTAPDAVRDAIGGVLARRGRIDALVCSHGVVRDGLFAMAPERDWLEVIEANLTGAMRCARAVVRPMMAGGGGAIVFVASVAALRASPGQAGYAASKGGLLALTRTLAAELGPKGIRVNAVVPGLIDAGMVKRMDRRRRDERLAQVPLRRLGEAREVADAVAFLASDAASYVTGQALVVDGGLSL